MSSASGLAGYGRAYVWAVIAIGLSVIGSSLFQLYLHPIPWQWFLLAGLTLVSGSATVKLPSIPASISISEAFVFTAVLLYGTAAGTVIVALDGLVISFWIAKYRREPHRALFNTAAPAVSAWCSAHIFYATAGIAPLVVESSSLNRILPALVLFATTYFALNSWLITFAIAAETRLSPLRLWREHFVWLSLNYFCGASVAFLLVGYTRGIDLRYVAVIVPLLLVLYFTFKTSMGRVEDAQKHVEEVNRLYLSTIETLAMAIDAKDQITHGHIRRVQEYAIGLARRIGVTDEKLIKAIEAAALLHDTGKLAVPEYILNKPGKLTAAEFEKMKVHASVGADILSAIDFPYPVVPIVRHHHEHWDGGGYPSGLKGTDIPIGARILAVVDCFDALTSDRPYRTRVSDNEALRILMERRGSMYDPLIVDTFVTVHEDITPEALAPGPSPDALNEIASSTQSMGAFTKTPSARHILPIDSPISVGRQLAHALAGKVTVDGTGEVIVNHLHTLIPFTLGVAFVYEPATDELLAAFAMGEGASIVKGLKMGLGQRPSGWVGANRQTIVNSDPTLDLGTLAHMVSPRLRSCLSTSLLSDDQLVGVLTLYSPDNRAFTDEHRRILEAVARQATDAVKHAVELDRSTDNDLLTGLPKVKQLEQLVDQASYSQNIYSSELVLLFIDVVALKQINILHGRSAGDDALRHVVERVRSELRAADVLFRYGSDEFVALLQNTNSSTAATIAGNVGAAVGQHPLALQSGSITIEVTGTIVRAPYDGTSLRELIAVARRRSSSSAPPHGARSFS